MNFICKRRISKLKHTFVKFNFESLFQRRQQKTEIRSVSVLFPQQTRDQNKRCPQVTAHFLHLRGKTGSEWKTWAGEERRGGLSTGSSYCTTHKRATLSWQLPSVYSHQSGWQTNHPKEMNNLNMLWILTFFPSSLHSSCQSWLFSTGAECARQCSDDELTLILWDEIQQKLPSWFCHVFTLISCPDNDASFVPDWCHSLFYLHKFDASS